MRRGCCGRGPRGCNALNAVPIADANADKALAAAGVDSTDHDAHVLAVHRAVLGVDQQPVVSLPQRQCR